MKTRIQKFIAISVSLLSVCVMTVCVGTMLKVPIYAQQADKSQTTVTLELNKRKDTDNAAFSVSNMFPGDMVSGDYYIRVIYEGSVTVKFHVDIGQGYEKLAEVLKCKVVLSDTGEVLHDGLMKDVSEPLEHAFPYADKGEEELLYQITAYLDTSVGNEYQNTSLEADFVWWIEAEEKADSDTDDEGKEQTPSDADVEGDDVGSTGGNKDAADITTPGTGDYTNMMMWLVLAVCAAAACIVLIIVKKRKEGRYDEQ